MRYLASVTSDDDASRLRLSAEGHHHAERHGLVTEVGIAARRYMVELLVNGATDEFGYHAVENRMHLHDLHATVLNLMGLDHEKLTYRYAGRNFRLTDVAGTVAKGIIA